MAAMPPHGTPPRIDPLDAMLIHRLHGDFPLTEQPFRDVGEQLGLTEHEVIARLQQMLDGSIRWRFWSMHTTR